jgi:acetylornithine/N-succinyldiaminopimelate aminotransferase
MIPSKTHGAAKLESGAQEFPGNGPPLLLPEGAKLPEVEMLQKEEIVGFPMAGESTQDALLKTASAHLYPNYAQPPLVIDRGQGAQLWDKEGKRYIDFFAGIAVSSLGHNHPALVGAISRQAEKLMHLSNYYYTEPNIRLAGELCRQGQMDRVLFCNSGTEAMEASLKLVRRFFFDRGQPERDTVIAFDNSFHGRTLGSLAATGQKKYREGFGQLSGAVHAPYGDLEAVRALMSDRIAAIVVEPVQGEGGVIPAPPGFLAGLRTICDERGALLILDEIQTGVGRTGAFLACHHVSLKPDVVTMAKGLGGGFPIGAMLCTEALSGALPPGSHGTTFGGNPLASAAALAVLETIESSALLARVRSLTQTFESRLDHIAANCASVDFRRGQGLLQGLVLKDPSQGSALLSALRDAGLLVTFAGGTTLRLTPPLTITDAELEEGLGILEKVLGGFS